MNKLVSIAIVPAGAVYLVDNFITNMPHVMEGGLWIAGMGGMVLGVNGVKKLLHSATADKPAEQAPTAPSAAQEAAPEASFPAPMTVHQLAPAPSGEDLLKAFQMGADSARSEKRLER